RVLFRSSWARAETRSARARPAAARGEGRAFARRRHGSWQPLATLGGTDVANATLSCQQIAHAARSGPPGRLAQQAAVIEGGNGTHAGVRDRYVGIASGMPPLPASIGKVTRQLSPPAA